MLVLLALICFCVIFILADIKLLFPLLLFHLPWIPLLRLSPYSSGFFSIAMILIIIRLAFRIKKNVNIIPILIAAYFITFELIVRFARMEPYQPLFFHSVILLILMTLLLGNKKNYSDFRICAIYFSIGLFLSCFASYLIISSSYLQQFITIINSSESGTIILRNTGLNYDPNVFSSQIIIAIICLMILLKNIKSSFYWFINLLLMGALLYFGFASISKMFLFSIGIIGIVWMLSIFISRKKLSYKTSILFLFIIVIIFISESDLFLSLFNNYAMRLSVASDLSSLTTGRSNLQVIYIDYIRNNLDVLIFGQGFTYKILQSVGNDMHNTFIEVIYEGGIIGTCLLGAWYFAIKKYSTPRKIKIPWEDKLLLYLFLLGYFLPWFVLDLVFFEQIFLFLILLTYLKNYLFSKNTGEAIANGD